MNDIENIHVAFSCFRISAHRLEVETGRWHKPVKNVEHVYIVCGDEVHVILISSLYNELRKHVLNHSIGQD